MERITINLAGATSKEGIQDILVSSLPLPDYYGRNLDALYDCASTVFIKKRTEITIIGIDTLPEELVGYGNSISNIFKRVAHEFYQVSDSSLLIVK